MGRPKKEKPNKQGLYEVKITIGKNFDGTLIRKSFRSSISKADARAKAEQYKINKAVYEQTGENIVEPTAITFETWANKWLESYKHNTVKQHTYLFTYKSNVEKYLIPYFKKAKLINIKQIDIQKYFNTVVTDKGKPLAKSTLDKHKMILKSMFDAAIDNDLCYKNPVKNIRYPHIAEKEDKHVYSRKQKENVIEYSKKHNRLDIVILLETGVRRSELLGLKWSDIDFENNTMHIQRAVTQTKGKIIIDKPKTETSDRFIPFSNDFAEYLKLNYNQYEYVVGTSKPQSPSTFATNFKNYMESMATEISCPVLTTHELRHTFGTLLREDSVDIYTIQKVMGHSDISVTAAIYVHNDIDVLRKQMKIDAE